MPASVAGAADEMATLIRARMMVVAFILLFMWRYRADQREMKECREFLAIQKFIIGFEPIFIPFEYGFQG
mgnify:CR=1 FL=1|jgi:hypothetical protein